MNNKTLGRRFEKEISDKLYKNGYFVAYQYPSPSGSQPADLIAVKNQTAVLIDCKVCSRGCFKFSRIENNQHLAMEKWKERTGNTAWFALKTPKGIYMISYSLICRLEKRGFNQLSLANIEEYTIEFKDWNLV